jgi:hypothetical protein
MPAIPAWEKEIVRIMVQSQPRQKVSRTPSQRTFGHGGMCLSSQLCGKQKLEDCGSGHSRQKLKTYLKNKAKSAGGYASSGRERGPEFKPQYYQNQNNTKQPTKLTIFQIY